MFFRKQSALELDEYKTLLKRITDLDARVLSLEASNEVFRNQVLRKVQIQHKEKEPEDLNKPNGGIIRYGSTHQDKVVRQKPTVKN